MEDLRQVVATTARTLEVVADGLLARSALLGSMAAACKALGNAYPAQLSKQTQLKTALQTESVSGKKRGRTKRDPDAPSRPMTAFMRYLTAVRKTEQYAQIVGNSKEKLATVAQMWKVLPQMYKQGYIEQERKEIQAYKANLDTYRRQKQPSGTSGAAPAKARVAATQPDEELPPTQDENDEGDEPSSGHADTEDEGVGGVSSASAAFRSSAPQSEEDEVEEEEEEEEEDDGFVRRGKGTQGKKQKKERKRPKRQHDNDSVEVEEDS